MPQTRAFTASTGAGERLRFYIFRKCHNWLFAFRYGESTVFGLREVIRCDSLPLLQGVSYHTEAAFFGSL